MGYCQVGLTLYMLGDSSDVKLMGFVISHDS